MWPRLKFLLPFLLLANVSFSGTIDCLVQFASVPDDAVDYPLIETTYDKLFDTLGKRIGDDALSKMVEGGGTPLYLPVLSPDGNWAYTLIVNSTSGALRVQNVAGRKKEDRP